MSEEGISGGVVELFYFLSRCNSGWVSEGLEAEECDNPSAIPGLFWRASPAKLDYVEHTGKERLLS